MKRTVDLRSDTVTKPTKAMLEAMFTAEVDDDVIDVDPTVRRLEDKLAAMFGFQSALFCPSGTMTNQIALQLHTRPGDEIICEAQSHIYLYEGGGPAANAGCSLRLVNGTAGQISAAQIFENINPENEHAARTALVSLENTANKAGGCCYSIENIQSISALCKEKGLPLHLDGARLFNALVATGQKPEEYHGLFDSISICLSKGLGCPVGSVLLLNESDYYPARRIRKRMGGGMRQAGYLAAAALYALEHHVERLAEDHKRATILAKGLRKLSWVEDVVEPETNIIIFKPKKEYAPLSIQQKLEEKGLRLMPMGADSLRMVTHLHITDEDVAYCLDVLEEI